MEFTLSTEQRAIVSERRNSGESIVTSVPDTTAPHIVARLKAGLAAIFEKRSISAFDELLYQEKAAVRLPLVTKRPDSKTVDQRHGELCGRYSALSYDQIRRAVRLDYDEDTLNALNLAMLGKQIS
jgi:hypothetical protein